MNAFDKRIRELRQAKCYSLRELAPLVGVAFLYLSKVECAKLDFGEYPSALLIHRLTDVLDAEDDELMLLAKRIPSSIANRVLNQPDVFLTIGKCDSKSLAKIDDDSASG